MEQISYKTVYVREFLNEIKKKVKSNGVKLIKEKEKKTDLKMEKIIEELFFLNDNSFNFRNFVITNEENTERIMCTLILYYTALYNDNLELLNNLLEDEYSFGWKRNDLFLCILDKRISDNIDIELLKKTSCIIDRFYHSLRYEECGIEEYELDDNVIIERFCYLFNNSLDLVLNEKNKFLSEKIFNKLVLCYFEPNEIINATMEQKRNIMLSLVLSNLTKDNLNRLKNLMFNYNFSTNFSFCLDLFFEKFTDEELLKIDENTLENFLDTTIEEYDIEGIRKFINNGNNYNLIENKIRKIKFHFKSLKK